MTTPALPMIPDDALEQAMAIYEQIRQARNRGRMAVQPQGALDPALDARLGQITTQAIAQAPTQPIRTGLDKVFHNVTSFLGQHGGDLAAGLSGMDPTAGGLEGFLGSGAEAYGNIEAHRSARAALQERRAASQRADARSERMTAAEERRAASAERSADTADQRADAAEIAALAAMIRAQRQPAAKPEPMSEYDKAMERYRAQNDASKLFPRLRSLHGDQDGGGGGGEDDKALKSAISTANAQVDDTRTRINQLQSERSHIKLDPWENPNVTGADSTYHRDLGTQIREQGDSLRTQTARRDSMATVQRQRAGEPKKGVPGAKPNAAPAQDRARVVAAYRAYKQKNPNATPDQIKAALIQQGFTFAD